MKDENAGKRPVCGIVCQIPAAIFQNACEYLAISSSDGVVIEDEPACSRK